VASDTRGKSGLYWEFDGVDLAGVWVPDKYTTEAYEPSMGDRRAWFEKQAEGDCEVYTMWVNGECYFYSVKVYSVRRADNGEVYDRLSDYRKNKPLMDDACHGFIGEDSVIEEALAVLDGVVNRDRESLLQDKGGVASTV
jgi:hypothetical protein